MVKFVDFTVRPPNNSLERTQPQRDFMYDFALLRRSARSRWAANQIIGNVKRK